MKKRILSLIMAMVIVFAAATTACGKKEDSTEKAETKKEEAADVAESDKQAADEQDQAEEKVESQLSNPEELTDEKVAALYASIKESVKNDYLEPNNISPSEFQWPACELNTDGTIASEEDHIWFYLNIIYFNYMVGGKLYDAADFPFDIPEKKELMNTVLKGIADWYELPENNSIEWNKISEKIGELYVAIPENVKFDE